MVLTVFAIIGTVIGLSMIRKIIKEMNNERIIIYLILILVVLSTILLFTSGVIDMVDLINNKPEELFKFNNYCLK